MAPRVLTQMSGYSNGASDSNSDGVRIVSYETFALERKVAAAAASELLKNGPSGSKPGADVYGRSAKRQREGEEELLASAAQGSSERFRCTIM